MAKFAFTSDGYFVNLDLVTNMRIRGTPGKLTSMEVWFVGNAHHDGGLYFNGAAADELLAEVLGTHKVVGYPSDIEAKKNSPKDI